MEKIGSEINIPDQLCRQNLPTGSADIKHNTWQQATRQTATGQHVREKNLRKRTINVSVVDPDPDSLGCLDPEPGGQK
jgi:hypothetical protein